MTSRVDSTHDPFVFGPSSTELVSRSRHSDIDILKEFRGEYDNNSRTASSSSLSPTNYDDVFIVDDSFEERDSSSTNKCDEWLIEESDHDDNNNNNNNDDDECFTREELEKAFLFADKLSSNKNNKSNEKKPTKENSSKKQQQQQPPEIEIVEVKPPSPPKRGATEEKRLSNGSGRGKPVNCLFEAIDDDPRLDRQIEKIKNIGELTEEQVYYMVLKDINYYIMIISGNCEESWRHVEFKKYGKKSGNYLYENSAMISYREDQYMSAVKALQFVFCKKSHALDEYIVKVLLPEALIKICMQVYGCSKSAAENYLRNDHKKTKFRESPKEQVTTESDD